MTYDLPDGTNVEHSFGFAEIEIMGEVTAGRVIFGPEDCEPTLGATALDSVGVIVDPSTQRLRRLLAISLK
jgi:hypothetical protein